MPHCDHSWRALRKVDWVQKAQSHKSILCAVRYPGCMCPWCLYLWCMTPECFHPWCMQCILCIHDAAIHEICMIISLIWCGIFADQQKSRFWVLNSHLHIQYTLHRNHFIQIRMPTRKKFIAQPKWHLFCVFQLSELCVSRQIWKKQCSGKSANPKVEFEVN